MLFRSWGDICNFFRHVIDDLEKLTVSFAEDVVYVAVKLAKEVKHFVLRTLAEVSDCIEVFLNAVASLAKKVADAVKKAIEWLRMLFDWEDILLTEQVVSYYLTQGLSNLQTTVGTSVPNELISLFTAVKDEIVTMFNDLEKSLVSG